MSMIDWAKREIEIACKRERDNAKEDEWDYGCACYESALKAFNSLVEDGHSGMSIGFTKSILMRLIDGKPLTAIEDTDDIWNDLERVNDPRGREKVYQCKRMGSLFKEVYPDGSIKYSDVNYCYSIDVDNGSTYHSGLVRRIIEDMFPITMPYYPGPVIKVYCEEFLTDRKNGDFDTVGVFYALKSEDDKINQIEINRFFREGNGRKYPGWVEISRKEYDERKANKL